ncbi:hypothetical protein G6F47_000981 [Rhizopus delemar]|nr:hypothetical protein G6F49_000954 [Rhizopus delemar]KAG1595009.1 hypothetical protein G6F48_000966 [Rhizopus delemar]KAG1604388.1 hypothetical protein G6F47_000981 [Rhizopus delemar]KAG1646230.1 hypothetical protein G6F44_001025 [Rhizopus delemar]
MWRPRSDIGTLQHRNIHFKRTKDGDMIGVTLYIRAPKESQFLEKSRDLRKILPVEHTAFLAYLGNPEQVRSIQPTTIANILKQILQAAGIDTTVFGPHSIRSASKLKTVEMGHKIDDVKKHAHWSLSADTFERFYYKLAHQIHNSRDIISSIFSDSENNTTSGVEMEATKVGLDQSTTGWLDQTELGEWAMKKLNLDQPLAQQTISNILKNAETLYSDDNVVNNGKSLKTTRYPQLDDEVVKFVADMKNNNLPVNQDTILRYQIGVKCRPMHGESASVDITSENIQNELRKIEELLGPYDPVDIMNFDETGLYYQQPLRRTICSESLDGLKKLDVAFGRQNRKIVLLLDNVSVHKIRIPLNDIKLIFLLANTTSSYRLLMQFSHSYFVYTGIIDNFKAHFRAQQYDHALCLYITNAWIKVKPETIKICWQHTKILAFKERTICDSEPVGYPTSALPLEEEIVAELNGMLPDIHVKFDNKVTDVSQLSLEADESEMIVCYTTSITNNEETAEGNIDETEKNDNTEQDEQCVDIVECKNRLREAYETIIMYEVPLDDLDRKLHRRIRMRLADSCAELNKAKEQTDL